MLQDSLDLSERFACKVVGQPRSTQRKLPAYPIITNGSTRKDPYRVQASNLVNDSDYVATYTFYNGFGAVLTSQTSDVTADGTAGSGVLVTSTQYDGAGRPRVISDPTPTSGNPATLTAYPPDVDDLPVATQYAYDGLSRPTKQATLNNGDQVFATTITYPNLATTTTRPPESGDQVVVTNVLGQTLSSTNYESGSSGSSRVAGYVYDPAGNMTTYTFGGQTWQYSYDELGRRQTSTDPDTGTTTYSYDISSNLTQTVTATGTVNSVYDWQGRVTETTDQDDTQLSSFTYDPPGHKGVLASSTTTTDGQTYTTASTDWDVWNNPLDATWDIPASDTVPATLATAGSNYSETYTYYTDGTPKTVTYADVTGVLGGETVTTTNTSLGLARTGSTTSGGTLSTAAYTSRGQVASRTWPAGTSGNELSRLFTWNQTWDTPEVVNTLVGGDSVSDAWISFDTAGNPTQVTDTVADQSNCHTYDGYQQLTNAWTQAPGATPTTACGPPPVVTGDGWVYGDNPYWQSWTIDNDTARPTSRITGDPADPAASTTTALAYTTAGHANAVTSTTTTPLAGGAATTVDYGYDGSGQRATQTGDQSQTWTWDPTGRPTQVETTGGTDPGIHKYVYDTAGNRTVYQTPTKTVLTVGGSKITHTTTSGDLSASRQLTQGGALVAYRDSGQDSGALQYTAVDVQGSGVIQADPATLATSAGWTQNSYQPYGAARPRGPNTWAGDQKWLNLDHDPGLDLVQTGARLYDQNLQQFITPDPFLNPANPNPYIYALNNPVRGADPSGLWCVFGNCNEGASGPSWCLGTCDHDPARDENPMYRSYSDNEQSGSGQTQPTFYPVGGVANSVQYSPACHEDPACKEASRQNFVNFFWDMTGIPDAIDCLSGDGWACAWAVVGVIPHAKVFRPIKTVRKSIDRAADSADNLNDTPKPKQPDQGPPDGQPVQTQTPAVDGALFCSFAGATLVLMANGKHKAIKDIEEGDLVVATDPETGERAAKPVLEVFKHQDTVTDLQLGNGQVVTTTEDHPYWNTTDQQFQRADQLDPGDRLLTADGDAITVQGLDTATSRTTTAYNLHIKTIHTYHVSPQEVLVHNTCARGGNTANGVRLKAQLTGQEISGGHAFEKHILDQGEFPGIRTRAQFASHIEDVVMNGEIRTLTNGRTAFWRDGTVVIRNPKAADGGTAFQPRNGYSYFLNEIS